MNSRMIVVVVLAGVCGLSAMVLVQVMRKPQGGPALEETAVVFAAADIKPGESIAEAMLEVRQVPIRDVPEDAVRKVADAIDRAAQSPLDKGDMLRERKLAEKGAGRGMAALVRSGMRAFTIQTPSFSSSLAGFLLPGNKVDVLLTINSPTNPDDGSGGASTTTLLQNVEILAVHTTVNTPTTNKINPDDARSITVLVTPDDAALLDLGQHKGTLHLSLRNRKDSGTAKPKPATIADLQLPGPPPKAAVAVAAPLPEPIPDPEPEPDPEPTEVKLTVRTLRGTAAGADTLSILRPAPSGRASVAPGGGGRRARSPSPGGAKGEARPAMFPPRGPLG